ncbi:serine hydroxymethyltransferase [Maricaulis sp.]|uniref:serine hydroxymethyltransferase n=1 Tax=Maricaulis sp. TaxID=1486257 RepID=UPI003A91730A
MPENVATAVPGNSFFTQSVVESDREVAHAIHAEILRQQSQIELIASENIVSRAVLEAQGSPLTNKYAEGYPGKRYYGGCEHVDVVEQLAIDRAKALFDVQYANVQPSSGSQANQGVFLALLKPGDKILGLSLNAGGHLTHGARPNMSGKWFEAHAYGVRESDARIDYDALRQQANELQPQMIIAGGSAYPREIDFAEFRKIADEVGAYLMVDMAHIAGLVAGGAIPSPTPHAHVCTTTTHKTLRGPRGGMIVSNDLELGKKFNSAIFPGMQGGPLMHVIAGKAVAFGEALRPEFKTYAANVIRNCQVMAEAVTAGGYAIVSGGTDSHLALIDLRPKGLKGNLAEQALERAYMTCNKNGVPFDPEKPTVTSGLRVGSPAATTRGFGEAEFRQVGEMIVRVLDALVASPEGDAEVEGQVREQVKALTARFPIYPELA